MNKKMSISWMKAQFQVSGNLLTPLVINELNQAAMDDDCQRIEVSIPGQATRYRFKTLWKTRSTPDIIWQGISRLLEQDTQGDWPLLITPYLSPERLAMLEHHSVSGVDLCGNGIVIIPHQLYICRTGSDNRYPDSRPLNNPFRGRSAMVGRMLFDQPDWASLNALRDAINANGCRLSLSQASKTLQALEEELLIRKDQGQIRLQDRLRLLDELGNNWRTPEPNFSQAFRLAKQPFDPVRVLNDVPQLAWSHMGQSSVLRYVSFAQGGPRHIAVTNLESAAAALNGIPERVRRFADIVLHEMTEAGYYFQTQQDQEGVRWASPLQTWLELQTGDARQRDAANELRQSMLERKIT